MATRQARITTPPDSPGKTGRPEPERFRVSVPKADEAVLTWVAMQDNHSQSIRMLIRESIERDGYIDVVNRPVAQLPKRGRPAAAEPEHRSEPAPAPAPDPAPAALGTGDLDLSQQDAGPEILGIALAAPALAGAPAAEAAPVPDPPAADAGKQMEVNDIFSALRA